MFKRVVVTVLRSLRQQLMTLSLSDSLSRRPLLEPSPPLSAQSLDQLFPILVASTLQYVANFSASLIIDGNQMAGSVASAVAGELSKERPMDLRLNEYGR